MRKIILSVLMLFLVGFLAFAGGSKEQTGSSSGFTFSYMIPNPYYQWMLDENWYPALLQKAGVHIDLINGGPRNKYYQKVDLMMASGKIPDSFLLNAAQQALYGQEGALIDWAPLIQKYAPNVQKYIADNPMFKSLITTGGSKIYALDAEYPKISSVTFYRADLFKKAGITTDPTNIAEFTADLKKLKQTFSDVPHFYPLEGRDSFLLYQPVFHAEDYIDANGKVHGIYQDGLGYDLHSQGFKQLIEWERSLYAQGLIDPEWVAGTQTEESWQTKMLTGHGAVSDDFFTRPAWYMGNVDKSTYPNFQIAVMPYFRDQNGNLVKRATSPRYPDNRYAAISAKASPAVQEGIVKFYNFLYSETAIKFVDLGVEGQSYTMENGKPHFLVSWEKQAAIPLGTKHWMIAADRYTFAMPIDNQWYYAFQAPIVSQFATTYFDKYAKAFPELKYTTAQLKDRTNLLGNVDPAVTAGLVKFVNGGTPMSDWSNFVAQMDNLGYSKIVAIDQQAYDAMHQ